MKSGKTTYDPTKSEATTGETVFSRHETEVNRNDKKPYTRKGYTVKRKIFCVRGKAEPTESGLAGRLRFRTVVFSLGCVMFCKFQLFAFGEAGERIK